MTETLTAADLRPGDQVQFNDKLGRPTWPTVLRVINDGTLVELLIGDSRSAAYRAMAAEREIVVRRAA